MIKKVLSKDGTPIAYETAGSGPTLILVTGALGDRSAATTLGSLLADHFTVVAYDRRGRGESGDTQPYAVQREVEDIAAVAKDAGGSFLLFGHSSGAVLALEAAHRLATVEKLALYEPPFVVSGAPVTTKEYTRNLQELLAAGRRGDAVEHFMISAVGVPKEVVRGMRSSPMWPSLERYAHTLPYDQAVMGDTMGGRPLPKDRWSGAAMPVLVMVGGESPAMFGNGADELVALLADARRKTIPGLSHAADPSVIAPILLEFFRGKGA